MKGLLLKDWYMMKKIVGIIFSSVSDLSFSL